MSLSKGTGGGGGGTPSPLTTKGDLYSYDTGDARFPVGTDGQIIIADSAQAIGLRYADAATIPFNSLTDIPTNLDDNATAQTAASTTFVTVATTTVTLVQATKIHAVFTGTLKATTAAALASMKVVINGVSGRATSVSIQNITDSYGICAQHLSASLAAGTYTITAQMNRVSGAGTVNYVSGNLMVQGQQANLTNVTPSRIFYVAKNGGGAGADGSWSKPYSTISAAVTAAQLVATDINTPYGICLFSGAGTTQYSDAAPITITKGGLSIFTMAAPDFKAVNVQYSGSIILNLTGTNLFFGCFGFEINCPSGAAWNTNPSAIYMTGSTAFRAFFANMVLNSNAATRNAVYCDNASVTYRVYNSELKSGTSGTTNLPPINHVAGVGQFIGCDIQDRKAGGLGISATVTAGAATFTGCNMVGQVQKLNNGSSITFSQDTLVNTGSLACITTQATVGVAGSGIFIYSGVSFTTNTLVITGGETCNIGTLVHLSTGNGLDPLLNGGLGGAYFVTDTMPRYNTSSGTYWATSSPVNMKDALDRIAKAVSVNGVTPIPL